MARMRYIKPEFWTDSRMVQLSIPARLFYIGTWNFALCDKGHLEDDPLRLKMQVFPADNVDVVALLDELMAAGRIVRVTDGQTTWLQIRTLPVHQKTDPRWKPRCPACNASANLSETQESLGEALTSGNAPIAAVLDLPAANLSETLPNSPQEGRGGERRGGNLSRPATASPDTFTTWWKAWPRKEAKAKAQAAYTKAIRTVDPDELLRLTAEWFRARPDLEPQYIPLPASWLNARRWEDEPPTATKRPATRGAGFWGKEVTLP